MTRMYVRAWFSQRLAIGEELKCQRQEGNPRDPYAVAVTKSRTEVVGHIPYFLYQHFVYCL